MLKQILTDMYIDPELLTELSEEQKQILFFKMREEQIRRWKEREATYEENKTVQKEPQIRKSDRTSVKWRLGADNEVWVWVMGEHHSDKPYDVICEKILTEQAQQQAQQETEELRKTQEKELSKILEAIALHSQQDVERWKNDVANIEITKAEEDDRNAVAAEQYKTHAANQKKEVMMKKHAAIQRLKEDRTQEIYTNWKEAQEVVHTSEKDDSEWQESLRKSKAADERRRSIAKHARDDYKRLSMQAIARGQVPDTAKKFVVGKVNRPPLPPKPKPRNLETKSGTFNRRQGIKRSTSSSTRENIIRWFKEDQLPLRAGFDKLGTHIAPWFHGIISRPEAEEILNTEITGSFLIRVSEKIKGYVLSYRSEEGHKHFMIDASSNSYSFLGVDQLQHSTLADLVVYHQEEPITSLGNELLLYPCNQQEHMCDFSDLFD